jgi:Mn2+/Fe2+ NRAMP family transporter
MKSIFKLSLGILTSIAGFLEAGSLGTSLQAGAAFGFRLLWPIALGGVCIAVLTEMSGRLAAVSHHPFAAAARERFGFTYHAAALGAQVLVDLLVLAAEIAGCSLALQLATGVDLRVWALPVTLVLWLMLWRGRFSLIENGVAVLGLVTLAFVVAAFRLAPDWGAVAGGLLPRPPEKDAARYAFLAVGILGATISPYLVSFYSSGAIEEKWSTRDLPMNRATAAFGMGFGAVIAMAALIVAAQVFLPRGIRIEQYVDAAPVLTTAFPRWGFALFVGALFIGCFGAALELSLDLSYITAQSLGWTWGEDQSPAADARFALVYTGALAAAGAFTLIGVEPLRLTLVSMALTVLVLPLPLVPLLVLLNDERYVGRHRNGRLANVAVVAILGLAVVLALVAIPLQILGGS